MYSTMRKEVLVNNKKVEDLDPSEIALSITESMPGVDFSEALFYAQEAQAVLAEEHLEPTPPAVAARTGGLLGSSPFQNVWGGVSTLGSLISEGILGVEAGKQSTASQIRRGYTGR
jgi:hypothetical protein